jgi:hypothetical protein
MTSVIVVNAGSASLNVSVLGDGDDVRPRSSSLRPD